MLLAHNNLFASKAFFGHWQCLPCFIRFEILINFVINEKNCFLLNISFRKPSFLKKIRPIDMMSRYSVVVTQ